MAIRRRNRATAVEWPELWRRLGQELERHGLRIADVRRTEHGLDVAFSPLAEEAHGRLFASWQRADGHQALWRATLPEGDRRLADAVDERRQADSQALLALLDSFYEARQERHGRPAPTLERMRLSAHDWAAGPLVLSIPADGVAELTDLLEHVSRLESLPAPVGAAAPLRLEAAPPRLDAAQADWVRRERFFVDHVQGANGQGVDEPIKGLVVALRLAGFTTYQSSAGHQPGEGPSLSPWVAFRSADRRHAKQMRDRLAALLDAYYSVHPAPYRERLGVTELDPQGYFSLEAPEGVLEPVGDVRPPSERSAYLERQHLHLDNLARYLVSHLDRPQVWNPVPAHDFSSREPAGVVLDAVREQASALDQHFGHDRWRVQREGDLWVLDEGSHQYAIRYAGGQLRFDHMAPAPEAADVAAAAVVEEATVELPPRHRDWDPVTTEHGFEDFTIEAPAPTPSVEPEPEPELGDWEPAVSARPEPELTPDIPGPPSLSEHQETAPPGYGWSDEEAPGWPGFDGPGH